MNILKLVSLEKAVQLIKTSSVGYVHNYKGKDIFITDNNDLKKSKIIYSARYARYIKGGNSNETNTG